jgi:E1A/CREB-binding protein
VTAVESSQALRHKQQRLILLQHAAQCQHKDGPCPVTRHCADMKQLWSHISECDKQECRVPHCLSSKYILSHYHRCKDARCPICGPVRKAISREHVKQKQKQIQGIKQRQQQAITEKPWLLAFL